MGVGLVSFLVFVRGRETNAGEQTSSSPASICLGEEDGKQCHQNNNVCSLFLVNSA